MATQPAATAPYTATRTEKVYKPRNAFLSFLITVGGVVVGMVVFFALLLGLLMAWAGIAAASLKNDSKGEILSIDLRDGFTDHRAAAPLFGISPPSIVETVRALDAAASDPEIKGVFIRAGWGGMAPASSEELSEALEAFKASDKFVVAFGQGFENTTLTSYAPVAPAEIWMQDTTAFAVSGLRSESEYLKGVFDKIGADPEFVQFYEYKTAADTYDETEMTEAGREALESWMGDVYDEMLTDVSRARGLDRARIESVFDRTPLSAEDAMAAGMIDRLGHYEEARMRAQELAGNEDAKFVSITDYDYVKFKPGASVIAMIGGQGGIMPGLSDPGGNPFGGSPTIGSDTLAEAFDAAAKDEKVKAIVFRISSPGGSAAASDQIHAAVERAKDAGKPVIVSMGQYAASGGYYVSANADHIIAMPTTITGSIGVLAGKIALEGTFEKIGYNIEAVDFGGPYLGVYSADTPFTEYQSEAWYRDKEDIYEDFTQLVAEGRNLPLDDVLEIAKGRVWTGKQAKELGLVDELGGIKAAIAKARELAEIEPDQEIRIKRFPRDLTTEEQLERLFQVSADASADLAALSAIAQTEEVKAILRAREAVDSRELMKGELKARLPRIE